jgi:Replication-relaxation
MLRYLAWRVCGVIALTVAVASLAWLLSGGPGDALRGAPHPAASAALAGVLGALGAVVAWAWRWVLPGQVPVAGLLLCAVTSLLVLAGGARLRARSRRRYVRLRVEAYRTDVASADAVVGMFEVLHRCLQHRWWRRLLAGQPSVALEAHCTGGSVWLAVACPQGSQAFVQAALRTAYPNCRLSPGARSPASRAALLRLKKHDRLIKRAKALDRFEHAREPAMNRLLTVLAACGPDAFVQVTLTPTPVLFERYAKRLYKRHEARLSEQRRDHLRIRDRSLVEDAELRGGLAVQHRPLFFVDLRVLAADRQGCERIASVLRAGEAENRLLERGTAVRHGLFALYDRRVARGEGNPVPCWHKGVFASTELASIWHLPSSDYVAVPLQRGVLPVAPAPPGIFRPADGGGTLRDAFGPVSIHPEMRRQNTAVPGTVEQGKSSYLVASVAEDLRRERCAVIVLDPKGDAAEAAVSLVPERRTCTLLDLSHPTCGFDPLAADAPGDVIADYVVAALKQLFDDSDIRASSDRYLRNAIIAVLAYDRSSTMWDAARLLSVGEEGYAFRARVGAHVRGLPELKEISEFFTAELSAQLADARSTTTAKLDAPVNKLARLLNSPSIKRVLLNDSLRIDFDRVIAGAEVLVVKGALGVMGAGNTSVLMQLLVGMLDAALARQQDLVPAERRVAVALKVDEAPLVLNRGFAETMALKRSAGLETVACWQTDAQWTEPEVRDQLDALFAHRVYFATASVRDARASVGLTMAEFSDSVRPDIERLSALGRPDVRLRLPRHHAIASWSTPAGRQSPFVAETIPLRVSSERLAYHAARQAERGGRYCSDLSQPHWDRESSRGRGAGRSGDEAKAVRDGARTCEGGEAASREGGDRGGVSAGVSGAALRRASEGDVAPRGEGMGTGVGRLVHVPPSGSLRADDTPAHPTARDGYRELAELDGAHSARRVTRKGGPRTLEPEPLDIEILALVASMGHVLSSQIHRRFNHGRAATTTQRRLKRLADAQLLQRLQFHRRDGGGVPMCCAIAPAGLRLLSAHGRSTGTDADIQEAVAPAARPGRNSATTGERTLRQVRHEVHVAGWVLELERVLGGRPLRLRGARESVLSPPRPGAQLRTTLGPGDLVLPGGRVPHDFLRTDARGERAPIERFETVRPDATVELPDLCTGVSAQAAPAVGRATVDVMVELDDRLPPGPVAGKLERYDHLIAGWAVRTSRYGPRGSARPVVVFVCRDRPRARECARRADPLLGACRAYAGEYPANWEYSGRAAILFVAERDVYGGRLDGYGVPRLPPQVRASIAHGDPRAGEASAEPRALLVALVAA